MDSWLNTIPLLQAGYHETLLAKVAELRQHKTIYPPQDQILRALAVTPFQNVKAVILGQDPYHGSGQANGLAFSVPDGVKIPPSLRNIFKEVAADVYEGKLVNSDVATRGSGNYSFMLQDSAEGPVLAEGALNFSTDLTRWAKQGVLLLNAVLTVEAGNAGSHKNLDWQRLTDEIVEQLSNEREHVAFLLWGAYAQSKRELIDNSKHLILEAAHPSPFSAHRGFFGCRHFSVTNAYLQAHTIEPINW